MAKLQSFKVLLTRDTTEQCECDVIASSFKQAESMAFDMVANNHDAEWSQTDYLGDPELSYSIRVADGKLHGV